MKSFKVVVSIVTDDEVNAKFLKDVIKEILYQSQYYEKDEVKDIQVEEIENDHNE